MKIFYINYADLSVAYGATVCIVELAKALARQGHEVTVIVPQFKRNPLPPDSFDLLTIPNRDIRFLRKVWFYLASAFWVTFWALRKRPDILYWGEMTYTITPYLVSKLTGIPYAIIAHGFAPDELRVSRWRMAIVKWCQKVYFGNASVVVTVTPKIAERIHEVYGIPKEKLVPIENGVNLERFRPMDKFEARRQLGLPETGYIYIGWVGYFFPWSGVETLLEAAKKILAEFPNARFIIVGHGVWGTHLSDFAQSLGLKVHLMKPLNNAPSHSPSIPLPDPATWQVCFTGEVANELVPVFINSWDIATAPYPGGRNEKSGGSSMKIREYFGCGVPVATTDVAGIGTRWLIGARETESKVTIGERGVLTVPDDVDAFAEGLLILIRDASLREQMGKNAREFAETHCSWDEIARQTVKAFEGVFRVERSGLRFK
jgi:glycosyltransferase involved in cell wall biosynthesis